MNNKGADQTSRIAKTVFSWCNVENYLKPQIIQSSRKFYCCQLGGSSDGGDIISYGYSYSWLHSTFPVSLHTITHRNLSAIFWIWANSDDLIIFLFLLRFWLLVFLHLDKIILGIGKNRDWAKDWNATGPQDQLRSGLIGPPSSLGGVNKHLFMLHLKIWLVWRTSCNRNQLVLLRNHWWRTNGSVVNKTPG